MSFLLRISNMSATCVLVISFSKIKYPFPNQGSGLTLTDRPFCFSMIGCQFQIRDFEKKNDILMGISHKLYFRMDLQSVIHLEKRFPCVRMTWNHFGSLDLLAEKFRVAALARLS